MPTNTTPIDSSLETPNRPTTPLRFAVIGTVALVAALSGGARADIIIDAPNGYAVRSQGSVSVGKETDILGSLGAAGSASLGTHVTVTGDLSTGTPYAWTKPLLGPLPSAGTDNISVSKNGTLSLDAGAYAKFNAAAGATVTLESGDYIFSTFDLGSAGRVVADTSGGDVYLFVSGKLSSGSKASFETTGPGSLFVVTGGSASFGSTSNITALLYSLGSQSFGKETTLKGLTWSQGSISIGQDSLFQYASVPAPAAAALLALAGATARRRRA